MTCENSFYAFWKVLAFSFLGGATVEMIVGATYGLIAEVTGK